MTLSPSLGCTDQFSSIACIPMVATIMHCFCPKRAKTAKTHLKRGYPLFCTFFILYAYNFFPGVGPSPKMVFF